MAEFLKTWGQWNKDSGQSCCVADGFTPDRRMDWVIVKVTAKTVGTGSVARLLISCATTWLGMWRGAVSNCQGQKKCFKLSAQHAKWAFLEQLPKRDLWLGYALWWTVKYADYGTNWVEMRLRASTSRATHWRSSWLMMCVVNWRLEIWLPSMWVSCVLLQYTQHQVSINSRDLNTETFWNMSSERKSFCLLAHSPHLIRSWKLLMEKKVSKLLQIAHSGACRVEAPLGHRLNCRSLIPTACGLS